MIEAISFKKLLEDIQNKHGDANSVPIGILLGHPNCNFMKENILLRINQYHHMSNYNIDFYFPGYGAYWNGHNGPQEVVCNVDGVDWLFSDKAFCEFINAIENISRWKYSGETELILINYSKGKLDFSEVLVFWLDRMVAKGNIYSPASFFQEIFRIFKKDGNIYNASDKMGFKGIANSISEIVNDKIPIFRLIDNKCFCVKNYKRL